jgi:hypothetical protein
MRFQSFKGLSLFVSLILLAGCETMPEGIQQARFAMSQRIQSEPPGDYFIGRRYYKPDYKIWGYVRRPGQPWSTAQLVMLNENQKLAPDRAQRGLNDNDYEYKLFGHFSGDKVYELVSDRFYPEFVLTGYELRSTHPAPIFPSQITGRPSTPYQIEKPE